MSDTATQITGARKCAVLCMALGPRRAAHILESLTPDELATVSREMASMTRVEPTVVQQVLEEFQSASGRVETGVEGGIESAERFLVEALGPAPARNVLERIETDVAGARLARLEPNEPHLFVNMLLEEHPQTIAVILAHLEQGQAAKALGELPTDLGAEVLFRMARMDKVAPEALNILERSLRSRTDWSISGQMSAPGDAAKVARLLNLGRGRYDRDMLAGIDQRSEEVGGRVRALMFVFDDLLLIDGKGIQKILAAVDTKELAMGLKGARAELKAHIRSNMSERAGAALEEEMELMGAVRMKDVEQAQQQIMTTVRDLEESGEIIVKRESGGDEFVT